jgi:two-component system, cell cycle sensor histidine kinase and response regulator CckA
VTTNRGGHGDDRYRQLFEHVGTGVAVAAADGRFLDVNPAFCATVGYTVDELATMSVMSLTHADDRAHNLELIGELLAGTRQAFSLEKRYLRKEGGPVWVRAHVSVLRGVEGAPQLVATTEDIGAQKQVEARLEQSQALLRIAGEVGRVGGWAIDTDPVALYWSDEVHDLAGYPRGKTPPLEDALALYPGEEQERMGAAVETCMAEGTPFDIECLFHPRGGGSRWVRVVGEPRRAPDGTIDRIQGAIIDISEQKRAQQQTAMLADRLQTTMESITDALYTIGTDWRFTYVNGRASELLERDPEELLGQDVWSTFPEVVGSPLETAFRAALAEDRTVVLDEFHYPPLERFFSVNVYPSAQGLAVYFRDVTDKRRDRWELEERGARLAEQAALLDEAQDAILVRDLDGRISYWNRSAERIYGWSAQEAQGRRIQELLRIDPDVDARAADRLLAEGSWTDEVSKTAKDGRQLVIETRWTLVRDDDGQPSYALGIDTDVTERKRLEQQFLRSQRMESLGKLAGGIAHDLNNALVPISASIQLLRSGEQDPVRRRVLDVMETSAKHGARMVDQVLSFARGVDGRREPLALGDVIGEVQRISTDTFPKDIRIETRVPDGLWTVVGDPTQLQQVLVNLCVNARDAMPTGGTITVAASNLEVEGRETAAGPSGAPTGRFVSLRVTDTGTGIATDVIEQVFDPFFSTKPSDKGTGLGLSTSAIIVDSHGGEIDVTSEPGVGTTFEVRLPAEPDVAGRGSADGAELPTGDGELVLVVDDEPGVREITRLMLESFGYRVLLANDGRDGAMAFEAREDELAVVITDLMMPVVDGYALLAAIQQRPTDVPVIAMSGLNTSEASDRAIAAGAARFLAKPYDSETLLGAIRQVVRSRAG